MRFLRKWESLEAFCTALKKTTKQSNLIGFGGCLILEYWKVSITYELERRFQLNKCIFNFFCISWRIWMSTINSSLIRQSCFRFFFLFLQTFVLFLSQQSVLKDFCLLPQVLKYLRLLFLFVEKIFFIHKITTYCSSVFFKYSPNFLENITTDFPYTPFNAPKEIYLT